MKVSVLFPSLFGETAARSAYFIGASVTKSEVNPECAIVKSVDGKPVEWLLSYMQCKGLDTSEVDEFVWRSNSDGSISLFSK